MKEKLELLAKELEGELHYDETMLQTHRPTGNCRWPLPFRIQKKIYENLFYLRKKIKLH